MIYYNYYDSIDGIFKVNKIDKKQVEDFTSNLYLFNIGQGLIVEKSNCFRSLIDAINDLKKDRIKNYIVVCNN